MKKIYLLLLLFSTLFTANSKAILAKTADGSAEFTSLSNDAGKPDIIYNHLKSASISSGIEISNVFGDGSLPVIPGFTTSSGTQVGRLYRWGLYSTCSSPNSFFNLYDSYSHNYEAYTFKAQNSVCTEIDVIDAPTALYVAVYKTNFNPSNIIVNGVVEGGYSGLINMSFEATAGETYVIVVNEVSAVGSATGLSYSINITNVSAGNQEVVCNPIDINLDVDGSYKLDSLDMIELTGVTPDSLTTFDDLKIFAYPDTFTTANIEWPVFVRVTQYDGRFEKKRCWAMVTVHDSMPPTVVGKDIEVMLDSAGLAVINKEQVTDSATFDVSGIVSTSIDKDTFTCENIGENWVMLSATDIYGNVGTDSVLVTVSAGLPNLDSIQDITITLATGVCETAIEYPIPVLTQICGISATQTAGLGRDAMFPVGTTTEEWTIIDHKGDTTLVSFDVIVTSPNAFPSFNEIDSITVGDTLTTVNIAINEISAGTDCMPQTVTVTAETDNYELIDSLTVVYTEGDTTGTVIVTLVPEMTGTASIKVTVTDSEGASMFRNFDLVVNAVPKSTSEKEGQIATAVWTKEIEMGINMFPNPTQDMVTIDIRNYNASQAEVAVFSLTGSEVMRKTYPAGETIRFSMKEQISGVYLVKMNIDGNNIIKKLVVDKK